MTRRRRPLSDEERRLWNIVRETAAPLRPAPPAEAAPAPAPEAPRQAAPASTPAAPPPPPRTFAPVPPGHLDRRTRSRLTRGIADVDARIDLHGMTQAVAHQKLRHFLEREQANGARLVLVITGKGSETTGEFGGAGRGVLKRSVPDWLEAPDMRGLVAGFDEAGRRHGGGGALYVRIRRKRMAHHE